MSGAHGPFRSLRSNLALFAFGYVAFVIGHYVAFYRGWIDEILIDIVLTLAIYVLAVAVAGYVFFLARSGWNGAERRALALRYAAISLGIDVVPAFAFMSPDSLSTLMRGFRAEPGITTAIIGVGLVVFAIGSLIFLAVRDVIARLVLYGVNRLLTASQTSTS